ncbi:biotin--[acetyl-CoA-carboxylase] ligase [Leyella stercorea]|uniref:biotin--[acetyl-CoA-carboxylase] ligase n=1 Tax=Leyella stercorea TaxID=363265 RepID=UPI00242ACAC7|nr:biotin--[acetyl-CoA-carboxylase] ligase [Leyella stercorea]
MKILKLTETTSTNDVLLAHPVPPPKEMVVAVAEYQTAGRGQAGNSWESERGKNLLFSILANAQSIGVADQYVLSMAGALALKAALDQYTDHITLKWPNDIYWRNRKISGTLIETTVKGKTIDRCVYGIGLNVNQREFRSNAPNPVSLYNIIGIETPLDEVLHNVLQHFSEYYRRAEEGDCAGICAEYNAALFRREGLHAYEDCATHERFEARISRVAPNGCLHLIDANGQERTYWMKEVRFIL